MTNLAVNCFVRHMTERGVERSEEEWRSLHIVRIIKGEILNGRFSFPINGLITTIRETNKEDFIEELYSLVARHIIQNIGRDVSIVPVPNSGAVVNDTATFQTLRLAQGVARKIGDPAEAIAMLRWKTQQEKAHEGGRSRDCDEHYKNLSIVSKARNPIVLFDDVITTGSQMYACEKILKDSGFDIVGMYAIASILQHGERADQFGWKITTRTVHSQASLFD